MDFQTKQKILEAFKIPDLLQYLKETEAELQSLETEALEFADQNRSFIGARGGHCEEARFKEAELLLNAPEYNPNGKKATVEEKRAWVELQKRDDPAFRAILQKQAEVDFRLEDFRIRLEALKRRSDRLKAVLRIREAQIRFLAGGD